MALYSVVQCSPAQCSRLRDMEQCDVVWCAVLYGVQCVLRYSVQCGIMQCSTVQFVLREGKRLSSEIFPSPNGMMSENFELY